MESLVYFISIIQKILLASTFVSDPATHPDCAEVLAFVLMISFTLRRPLLTLFNRTGGLFKSITLR